MADRNGYKSLDSVMGTSVLIRSIRLFSETGTGDKKIAIIDEGASSAMILDNITGDKAWGVIPVIKEGDGSTMKYKCDQKYGVLRKWSEINALQNSPFGSQITDKDVITIITVIMSSDGFDNPNKIPMEKLLPLLKYVMTIIIKDATAQMRAL